MDRLDLVLREVQQRLPSPGDDACRVFHGRGQCFAGLEHLTIDSFGDLLLVTLFLEESVEWLESLADTLQALRPWRGIALQQRHLRGAPTQPLRGELPLQTVIEEAGLKYLLQFSQRQNIGFFLDMAVARRWLAERAAGQQVLNLFAFTCAFSVVARAAGAARVVNIDMSGGALKRGQANHRINSLVGGVSYLPHNVFTSMGRLRRDGPYDLIIADPPSRQRGSFVIEADYPRLLAKLESLCAPGAQLLLCNNSPLHDTGFMQNLVLEHAPGLTFTSRLANPPAFVDANAEASLKVLEYRYGSNADNR